MRLIDADAMEKHIMESKVFNQYFKELVQSLIWGEDTVDARQLALKTRVCPICEDCPDGCPVETPKDSRNIVTNADRIRSMNDEELARLVYSFEDLKMPNYCQNKKECDDMLDSNIDIPAEKCIGCLLDWLQQKEEV